MPDRSTLARVIRLATLSALTAALALAARPAAAQGGAVPVVLDGRFGEWQGGPPAATDPADDTGAYADLRTVRVRHDSEALYLFVELEREVALQAMPGTLVLLLDTDSYAATGWREGGMEGVDLAVEFSPADPRGAERPRSGVAVRTSAPGAAEARVGPPGDVGLVFAPSHASRRFEVRILRGASLRFGRRVVGKLVSVGRDGAAVDETAPFARALTPGRPRPAAKGDPLARAPGTELRVVSWNVGREDLFEKRDEFGRILRALGPDVLMLDEVAGGRTEGEIVGLLNRIAPGEWPWRAVYGTSGGGQRGVVAARGQVSLSPAFDGILPYPDSALALLPADAPREVREAAERQRREGIPTVGAVVEIRGRRLLAVTVDLQCCGAPGDPADRLRRMEALGIRDAMDAVLRDAGVDGVVVAGDFNLVGTRAPLEVFTRGGEGRPALEVVDTRRLDGVSYTTWERAGDRFPAGRLDYVLPGGDALEVLGAFSFATQDLSAAWRQRHRLSAETSAWATDHLPQVTDLRWRRR